MEDLDVICLGSDDVICLGDGSQINSAPITTQNNGQQDFLNYPFGHQPNLCFYGNVLPMDNFPQPPTGGYIAPYNMIQGTSFTNTNPSPAFPVPASTSQQEPIAIELDEENPELVPLRRNPIRSVKKVSSPNLLGPNGTYIIPPKAPKTKKSSPKEKTANPKTKNARSKPQVVRKYKIQKVDQPAVQSKEEGKSSYHRLLDLQESDLVPSTEGITCPVCRFWILPGNGVVLKDCLHSFCRKCLGSAVQKSQTAQVRCPFVCEEYACESHLQDREVKCLVSPEDYECHLARSVFQAQCQATNAFHCVVPYCKGWGLIENGDGRVTWFTCPICLSKNCIACRAVHGETGCPREKGLDFLREMVNNLEKEQTKEQEPDVYSSPEELTNTRLLTNTGDQPADYKNLMEVTDMGLVSNTERFNCPICFSDIAVGEGVTLKDCLHNYCRECLSGTIRHSDTVLVKCPFVNDEYSCESFLQEREIKSLLTPEEFERHLAMSLALVERQSANSFHCKTPDCAGWCLVEEDANQFFCQVCEHSNCLSCAAIHEGKNCKQYQDMAAFESDTSVEAKQTRQYLERQLKSNKAMACPTCQVIVMKREGCDWLVCSMCRTEICWATRGPRWGPGGKGDNSGGCKCDFKNRKPCHPKCYNCH